MKKNYSSRRKAFVLVLIFVWTSLLAYDNINDFPTMEMTKSSPDAQYVTIQNHMFSPQTLEISINSTVLWLNNDDMAHTITSQDGSFDNSIAPGSTYSFQFTKAGIYKYYCKYHEQMTATIIVK